MPTGTVATAQCRSRENSLAEAMAVIEQRVCEQAQNQFTADVSANRKQQVGTGMRGDKIRTYRFQDDRVQDHLTGKTTSTKKVLQGNFDLLWN
jgi:peptide chain release factor 1